MMGELKKNMTASKSFLIVWEQTPTCYYGDELLSLAPRYTEMLRLQ
jgi:hypothetical protein